MARDREFVSTDDRYKVGYGLSNEVEIYLTFGDPERSRSLTETDSLMRQFLSIFIVRFGWSSFAKLENQMSSVYILFAPEMCATEKRYTEITRLHLVLRVCISSTRRRMAYRYRLPRPSATFTSAIFRGEIERVWDIRSWDGANDDKPFYLLVVHLHSQGGAIVNLAPTSVGRLRPLSLGQISTKWLVPHRPWVARFPFSFARWRYSDLAPTSVGRLP